MNPATHEIEFDGIVLIHEILKRIRPNYKVYVFNEIKKVKGLTLKQFNQNVPDFLDKVEEMRTEILVKNATCYPEDRFINDLFEALTLATSDSFTGEIKLEYNKWLLGNPLVTSDALIAKATTLYTNLESNGRWKKEHSKHEKIISLTTQVKELKALVSKSNSVSKPHKGD